MKNKILISLTTTLFLFAWTGLAEASFAITHSGATNPTIEGFGLASSGSLTIEPIANDMGLEAWSVAAGQTSQVYYLSGALPPEQVADIASQGFDLTLTARIFQSSAPTYDAATPYVFAFADYQSSSRRFDIMLGVNNQGETVVVLPDYFVVNGVTTQAFGSNFTVTDSAKYHTYQLAYDPETQLADLFVDNSKVIQNYAGNSMHLNNWGLGWGVTNGGQGNFNVVQLTSSPVPVPGAVWFFGSGIAWIAGMGFGKKRQ